MTQPHPPAYGAWRGRRWSRTAASLAVAALLGGVVAPALAVGSAGAQATPACSEALPYGASANADLLRLSALDLPLLPLGPVVDARIGSTGAGLAADHEIAAAAAARDVAANLLGLDLIAPLPAGGLGQTAFQQAPPEHPEPAAHLGDTLDLGVLRADLGEVSARASWDEAMRCGAATGVAAAASASLLSAAVLPAPGGRALLQLPQNLSSRAETALAGHGAGVAARGQAAASLADLRLFAGSASEVEIRVISQPELTVTATGTAKTSSVAYHAPVLEITGPGIGPERLDAPGTHLDIVLGTSGGLPELAGLPLLGGGNPLEELLAALEGSALGGLTASGEPAGRPLELAGLPGLAGTGELPLLGDLLRGAGSLAGLDELAVLRISLGGLQQQVTDEAVSGSAASLRVQLLSWRGTGPGEPARAVLDLGVGLLEAVATAPPPPPAAPAPEAPGEGGCADCPEALPVTGSTLGLLAGAGILLAVAGRLLFVLTSGGRAGRLTTG